MTPVSTTRAGVRAARGRDAAVLPSLLLLYLACWAAFVCVAAFVSARGGVVSMEAAWLAPVTPLMRAGGALAEGELLTSLAMAAWSLVPWAIASIAVFRPRSKWWFVAALSAVAVQWLFFLVALGVGA